MYSRSSIGEAFQTTEQLAISAFSLAAPTSHFKYLYGVSMVTAIPLFSKTQHSPIAISFPGSSRRCFSIMADKPILGLSSTGHRCSVKSTIRLRETTRETDRESPLESVPPSRFIFLAFKSDWMYFTH